MSVALDPSCVSEAHLGGGGLLAEVLAVLASEIALAPPSGPADFDGLLSRAATTRELVLAAKACWPSVAVVGVPGSCT